MVTDHDVGVEGTAPVSHQVIEVFDGTTSVCATFSLRGDPKIGRSRRTSARRRSRARI
jgi:hypothetical protein